MFKRRSMTLALKREIAAFNGWRTPQGETVCIEKGEIVTLHDGVKLENDHEVQLALGGKDEIENMRPMTPAEHKHKSADDARARAKDRRLTGQNKPRPKRRFPKGRGFGWKGWRKKIDGTAERRAVDA